MSLPLSQIPFLRHLGVRLERSDPGGEAELVFEPGEEHGNSLGMVHGGVVMTLLDVAQARAGLSAIEGTEQEGLGMITIEMKSSFVRPSIGPLRAVGKLKHRTRSMAFTEAEVFDAEGRLCAFATGTFKYVRRTDGRVPGGSD